MRNEQKQEDQEITIFFLNIICCYVYRFASHIHNRMSSEERLITHTFSSAERTRKLHIADSLNPYHVKVFKWLLHLSAEQHAVQGDLVLGR